jgi:hypothetical protein
MKDLLIDKDRAKEINKFLKSKREAKPLRSQGFNFTWEWIVREWFKRLQELEASLALLATVSSCIAMYVFHTR